MSYAIDTHCHIHFGDKNNREEIIKRALAANVKKMITVCCNMQQMGDCLAMVDEHEFIYTSTGVHPTDLSNDLEDTLEQVLKFAKKPKVVAIGETGLDYYHNKFDHQLQMDFLVGHINVAKQLNKPIILHCRAGKGIDENEKAFTDMKKVLIETHFSNAVMHCFSGGWKDARAFLDLGLMFSFTGIVTYPKNKVLRDVIAKMPLEKIMIETDSPYLAPQVYRGKANEPAYVVEVAKTIADVHHMSLDDVMKITSENAERFFGI